MSRNMLSIHCPSTYMHSSIRHDDVKDFPTSIRVAVYIEDFLELRQKKGHLARLQLMPTVRFLIFLISAIRNLTAWLGGTCPQHALQAKPSAGRTVTSQESFFNEPFDARLAKTVSPYLHWKILRTFCVETAIFFQVSTLCQAQDFFEVASQLRLHARIRGLRTLHQN